MLVVGQEASGKTALCHALLGHKCRDMAQTRQMSTVGIDTVDWLSIVALRRNNRFGGAIRGLINMSSQSSRANTRLHEHASNSATNINLALQRDTRGRAYVE